MRCNAKRLQSNCSLRFHCNRWFRLHIATFKKYNWNTWISNYESPARELQDFTLVFGVILSHSQWNHRIIELNIRHILTSASSACLNCSDAHTRLTLINFSLLLWLQVILYERKTNMQKSNEVNLKAPNTVSDRNVFDRFLSFTWLQWSKWFAFRYYYLAIRRVDKPRTWNYLQQHLALLPAINQQSTFTNSYDGTGQVEGTEN